MCLLNIPGTALDEIVLLAFFIYRMGPTHTLYSISHFNQQLVLPVVRQPLERLLTGAEEKLRAGGVAPLADLAASALKSLAESKPKKD